MTDTSSSQTPPAGGPTVLDDGLERLRGVGVRRDTDRRWFGGVCAGIAARFDVDPLLIRAAAIALTIAGGIGLPIYLVLWLLLPDRGGEILGERAMRHGDAWAIVLAVLTGVVVLGALVSIGSGGDAWGGSFWLLVPVALVVWFLATRSRSSRSSAWTGQTAYPPPPPPGGTPMSTPSTPYAAPAAGPAPSAPPAGYRHPPTPYGQPAYPGAAPTAPRAPYGGTPTPPVPPRPIAPPPPPVPPAPRRRRPSGFVGLVTLGLVIALVGLGVAIADPVGFPGEPGVLGLVLALAGASAVVLGLGATGRASGFSGFLVIALGLTTVFAALVTHIPATNGVGDRIWTPTTTTLPASYHLGVGDARLDLAGLAGLPETSTPPTIDVSVGAGELQVVVPEGLDVRIENQIGVGDLTHEARTAGNGLRTVDNRSGTDYTQDVTVGDDTPVLVVSTEIGIGDVTIIEER
ncbi:PspC domain-containing protein [Phycicoccus sonneratiae]|uniref:PspC domain-containing protein n=1 Tax=Phycicoccus sonneratiae TaxID=2807628 RepID=A0ABS2CQ41_9MICO|nr:PspC domain-containing protein [Phycicoccus sonneraticus]MBM6402005.1 PspC domain-containing protein [Phycicoccus sonneraticus]